MKTAIYIEGMPWWRFRNERQLPWSRGDDIQMPQVPLLAGVRHSDGGGSLWLKELQAVTIGSQMLESRLRAGNQQLEAWEAGMKAVTLKALKGSIKKWEGIVAGTEADRGEENCPLCHRFCDADLFCCTSTGEKCPVAIKTGAPDCARSPYREWRSVAGFGQTADTPARKAAAQAELDFLKSLLPK